MLSEIHQYSFLEVRSDSWFQILLVYKLLKLDRTREMDILFKDKLCRVDGTVQENIQTQDLFLSQIATGLTPQLPPYSLNISSDILMLV